MTPNNWTFIKFWSKVVLASQPKCQQKLKFVGLGTLFEEVLKKSNIISTGFHKNTLRNFRNLLKILPAKSKNWIFESL